MGMHIRVVYKQCCAVNYGAGHIVTGIQCSVAPIPKYQSDKSNTVCSTGWVKVLNKEDAEIITLSLENHLRT